MERIIRLHIEKLPEGVYLGTSDDVEGLVVQGETVAQVVEYAQDVARMLRDLRAEHGFSEAQGDPMPDSLDVSFVLAA